jgi:hypothetical protein
MRSGRRENTPRRLALAALFVCAAAPRAHAHFEGALLSARTAALGGSFTAIADDPSAVVENPAGLSGITRTTLLATYQRPYGIEGLDEGFVAVAVPVRWVSLGASWFHRGLDDALSEDRVTLALARDIKRTSEDASLSIGVGVDFATVSAQGALDGSDQAFALNAGVLLRPFSFIGMGYRIQNINQPALDVVSGGGTTELKRAQAFALSYYWQERLIVTAELFQDVGFDSSWQSRGGIELRVGRYVSLRGGLVDAHASAGVGLTWRTVGFDAAFRSHDSLGESYVVTLRYAHANARPSYGAAQ